MKYIFQIPILVLMLWASGLSCATFSVALCDRRMEAFVTKVCAGGSIYGEMDLILGRYALKNAKNMGSKSQTSTIRVASL